VRSTGHHHCSCTVGLYRFGENEELLGGRVLAPHRREINLASKCLMTGVQGKLG